LLKNTEFNTETHTSFVDYKKASERVNTRKLY